MKSRFLSLFLAVIAATVLSSCEDHHASQMLLLINGVQYDIDLPATDPVDLKTLCTEFDAYIQVVNYTDFERIAIDGGTMARSSVTLPVPELSQDEQITIDYKTGRLTGTIVLNTLHSGIDRIGATGRAVVPGDFYLSFIFRRLIMKYDNAGQLLYYCFDPDAKDGTMEENGFWDFKKHTYNGKTYYSYHAPDPAFAKRSFTGYNPGMRVLLDEHYRPLKSIHAKASRDGYLPDGEPIDGHDFYFFSPDHYILSLYVEREVQGRLKCVSYLQEVDNGEVVFDWWSTDHPEMAQWGDYTFDFSYDYVHFNSLQVLPDGNWLCSFRHLSSVVKIDRAGEPATSSGVFPVRISLMHRVSRGNIMSRSTKTARCRYSTTATAIRRPSRASCAWKSTRKRGRLKVAATWCRPMTISAWPVVPSTISAAISSSDGAGGTGSGTTAW